MKEEQMLQDLGYKSEKYNGRTPCEVITRSMGFLRPTKYFNIGKYAEFSERNMFKEKNAITTGLRHKELMRKAA